MAIRFSFAHVNCFAVLNFMLNISHSLKKKNNQQKRGEIICASFTFLKEDNEGYSLSLGISHKNCVQLLEKCF